MVLQALPGFAVAQPPVSAAYGIAEAALPEAPTPQDAPAHSDSSRQSQSAPNSSATGTAPASGHGALPRPQPKRILGIMPNFRAVSAGVIPPLPTAREAFDIATENTFDYSSFLFVGVTSLMAEGTDTHPQLGHGPDGFGRYYWRGFLDKADGNYLVIFVLPTIFRQDERYYARGRGSIIKRGIYAASRVFITPNYQGRNTFNTSEVLGRGLAQGISVSYYPSGDRTIASVSAKFAYALGRDALTNAFREYWPDIAAHIPHLHRSTADAPSGKP